jgi:hypothetical protein
MGTRIIYIYGIVVYIYLYIGLKEKDSDFVCFVIEVLLSLVKFVWRVIQVRYPLLASSLTLLR